MGPKGFAMLTLIMAAVLALVIFACSGGDDDDSSSSSDDTSSDDDNGDDTGGPPTYPTNHDSSWDCMICHASAFNGAKAEPHGDQYAAPDDCVGCHQMGDWVNDSSAPGAMNVGQNCLDCHADHHDKPFTVPEQCLVCHQ